MVNKTFKRKAILTFKCSFCGTELNSNDTFVVSAEKKHFCIEINPGHPPIKDCMEDYRNKLKEDHVRNERLRKEAEDNYRQEKDNQVRKEIEIRKEKIKAIPALEAKVKEFKEFQKQRRLLKEQSIPQ